MTRRAYPSEPNVQLGVSATPVNRDFSFRHFSWQDFKATKLYDALASAPVTAWYGICAWQRLPSLVHNLENARPQDVDAKFILANLAQGSGTVLIIAILAFMLTRGPARAKSAGLVPRLAAIFGTYLSIGVVFLPPHDGGALLSMLSLALIIGGSSFALYALAHLGRSFSIMAEARSLVTSGPYAVIRHPLYVGEEAAIIGLTLQYLSPAAVALVALQVAFQIMRIENEERILAREFPEYRDYMARSARFVPGLY